LSRFSRPNGRETKDIMAVAGKVASAFPTSPQLAVLEPVAYEDNSRAVFTPLRGCGRSRPVCTGLATSIDIAEVDRHEDRAWQLMFITRANRSPR
jgi:hypothetical protein